MEPTGNGVGGDLFAIVWDPKTKKLYGYNGSGRSPKSLTLAEFQRRGLHRHPAARAAAGDACPGTVDALVRAARPLRPQADRATISRPRSATRATAIRCMR